MAKDTQAYYCANFFTEFTDASMPPWTMLAWVNTGFRRILPILSQLTHFKLYSFRFKFRREMFLESINSAAFNTIGAVKLNW